MSGHGSQTKTIATCLGGPADGLVFHFEDVWGSPPIVGEFALHRSQDSPLVHKYFVIEGEGGVLDLIYCGAEPAECEGV